MVLSTTRNMVWQDMLDIARLVRYYEKMSSRFRRYDLIIRGVLLASASGITVNMLILLPKAMKDWVEGAFGGIVVIAVMLEFLAQFGRKAEVLRIVGAQCSELASQWDSLWADLNGLEAEDADIRFRNAELNSRLTVATDRAEEKVPTNDRINRACAIEAYEVMRNRFVADYPANVS